MAESDNLKICHVNCQSLAAHFDEFHHFFGGSDYHVICVSETWLRPEVSDAMVGLPGYTLFRVDRIGRHGGGVAFYLLNDFKASIIARSDERYCGKPEFMVAEIFFDGASKLLLAVVYRPPNIGHLQEFECLFLDLQTRYRHSIILGDFNADMSIVTYDSVQLNNFITSSNLYLVPHLTTHHLKNSNTWLDLCIIDDQSKLVDLTTNNVELLLRRIWMAWRDPTLKSYINSRLGRTSDRSAVSWRYFQLFVWHC